MTHPHSEFGQTDDGTGFGPVDLCSWPPWLQFGGERKYRLTFH